MSPIKLSTPDIWLHDPKTTKPVISTDDDDFSEDVITIDEHGLNGVACYHFGDKKWIFHTDTLVDYNEEGHETLWYWYYPPFKAENIFKPKKK